MWLQRVRLQRAWRSTRGLSRAAYACSRCTWRLAARSACATPSGASSCPLCTVRAIPQPLPPLPPPPPPPLLCTDARACPTTCLRLSRMRRAADKGGHTKVFQLLSELKRRLDAGEEIALPSAPAGSATEGRDEVQARLKDVPSSNSPVAHVSVAAALCARAAYCRTASCSMRVCGRSSSWLRRPQASTRRAASRTYWRDVGRAAARRLSEREKNGRGRHGMVDVDATLQRGAERHWRRWCSRYHATINVT